MRSPRHVGRLRAAMTADIDEVPRVRTLTAVQRYGSYEDLWPNGTGKFYNGRGNKGLSIERRAARRGNARTVDVFWPVDLGG